MNKSARAALPNARILFGTLTVALFNLVHLESKGVPVEPDGRSIRLSDVERDVLCAEYVSHVAF